MKVLELAARLRELAELDERLAALEAALPQQPGGGGATR